MKSIRLLCSKNLSTSCRLLNSDIPQQGPSSSGSGAGSIPGGSDGGLQSVGYMKAWQIHSYGSTSELQLSSTRAPILKNPTDVLVKVKAASVNPIDLAMVGGYGSETINILRNLHHSEFLELPKKLASYINPTKPSSGGDMIEFPLTLGRDFAGTIITVGHGVPKEFQMGDDVFGVVGVHRQGSHAEYVVVDSDHIRHKPSNLSFSEAASIPYVGLTTWSVIRITGGYWSEEDIREKKFLVLGGSGGIGTYAIQYLRFYEGLVVTTCSKDAMPMCKSLGANEVIDYKSDSVESQIQNFGPYDCILHFSGPKSPPNNYARFLKTMTGQLITLSPPFLNNINKYGLVGGTAKNLSDIVASNMDSWSKSKSMTKWGFFVPNGEELTNIKSLVENKKIRPVVQSVFKFDQLPKAYEKQEAHARGKIVVEI